MTVTKHRIIGRAKPFAAAVCQISDFDLSAGEATSENEVLSSDRWSLYCIDTEHDVALFVELPVATDLAAVPFMYMTQHETAAHAIKIPLGSLATMAEGIELPPASAFILSTGRCGSTLASKMLARLPNVWSVSEPDAFTNLAFARSALPSSKVDSLTAAIARICFRRPNGNSAQTVVLKPRSEATVLAGNLGREFPEARVVFLYRDAFGYVNSLYRYVQRMLGPSVFFDDADSWKGYWSIAAINAPIELLNDYFPKDADRVGHVDILTLAWFLRMRSYELAAEEGLRMTPIHYDDLNGDRWKHTTLLLEGCGIPATEVELAMRAFDKDSHAGSIGANTVPAKPIDQRARERIALLLDRWKCPAYQQERLA